MGRRDDGAGADAVDPDRPSVDGVDVDGAVIAWRRPLQEDRSLGLSACLVPRLARTAATNTSSLRRCGNGPTPTKAHRSTENKFTRLPVGLLGGRGGDLRLARLLQIGRAHV